MKHKWYRIFLQVLSFCLFCIPTIAVSSQPLNNEFYIVSASPDAAKVAGINTSGDVVIWDTITHNVLVRLPNSPPPLSVAWSPTGDYIAAAGGDPIIRVWCVDTEAISNCTAGELVTSLIGHESPILALAWSHDNRLASGSQNEIASLRLWDMNTYTQIAAHNGGDSNQLAWHPSENLLAQAGAGGGLYVLPGDLSLRVRERRDYRLSATDNYAVYSVAWSPTGDFIAYADVNSLIHVVNFETRIEVDQQETEGLIYSLVWSPDGKQLAASSDQGNLQIWDVFNDDGMSETLVLDAEKHSAVTLQIAWLPTGSLIFPTGQANINDAIIEDGALMTIENINLMNSNME
jgi:WD40 repeat protein